MTSYESFLTDTLETFLGIEAVAFSSVGVEKTRGNTKISKIKEQLFHE